MTDEAPSDKQLGYLQRLKYSGDPPKTKSEASALIQKLAGETTKSSYSAKVETIELPELTVAQKKVFDNAVGTAFNNLVIFAAVRDTCNKVGIKAPAGVGMIFNQTKADLRA